MYAKNDIIYIFETNDLIAGFENYNDIRSNKNYGNKRRKNFLPHLNPTYVEAKTRR